MTLLAAVAGASFVFLASATIILFIVGPTMMLQPRRRGAEYYRALHQPVVPSDLHLAHEDFRLTAEDGITLEGWLIKSNHHARGTVIYLHGVGDCKIDGLHFAKLLHDNNYNVVLYDSRRHGNSGGTYCTYGYYEKNDLIRVIDFVTSRPDLAVGSVGLFGTSMGAAVSLQAAALDKRIAAVVAENSFATLRTIFDEYQKRMIKLPFHYLRNIVIKRSERLARFKANEVSPLASVAAIHIPLLVIYGTHDRLINSKYSLMLFEKANMPKELYPVENASHTDTWEVAGEPYEQKLLEFFARNLT